MYRYKYAHRTQCKGGGEIDRESDEGDPYTQGLKGCGDVRMLLLQLTGWSDNYL